VVTGPDSMPVVEPPPRSSTPARDRPSQPIKKTSLPPAILTANRPAPCISTSITPRPSQAMFADHLFRSFMHGICADVRLWVKQWGVAWKVHKMVLVQAGKCGGYQQPIYASRTTLTILGFFHSLFLGGFSEHLPTIRRGKEGAAPVVDDEWTGEDIELHFDDPNITRAAFE
jgi:hypothetical protein